MGGYSINNTGGIIRATNGGTLTVRQSVTINGGTFSIDGTSTAGHASQSDGFTLNNVTASNAGTYRAFLDSSIGGDRFAIIKGTTVFTNSGVLDIRNESTSATNNISGFFDIQTGASLVTTGASQINIRQNSTTGGTGHNAYLQMGATGFANNGAINITSVVGSQGTAQLRATQAIANAGSITVDGPASSIAMSGQTLTQTAGFLNLINGGSISASLANIQGGVLRGTGTVNANVNIGNGSIAPGASAGTLTINGNLTLNAGSNLNFELDTPGIVGSGVNDLITVNGNLVLDGTLNITQLAGFGVGMYRLINYTGTLTDNGLIVANSQFNIDTSIPGQVNLAPPVPEPTSLLLVGMGLAGIIGRRRYCRR